MVQRQGVIWAGIVGEWRIAGNYSVETAGAAGKKTVMLSIDMKVPQFLSRSSEVSANFLCDNSSYLLGIDSKGKPERSRKCFLAAKEKHLKILENVNSPAAIAVKHFFSIGLPIRLQKTRF